MKAIRATITGRVHGVGFRATTAQVAADFGLVGWVRNRSDGSVEVWAQGDPTDLDRLTGFLDHGPSLARVHGVRVSPVEPDPTLGRFAILPTD